jgi:hypothetical protein
LGLTERCCGWLRRPPGFDLPQKLVSLRYADPEAVYEGFASGGSGVLGGGY